MANTTNLNLGKLAGTEDIRNFPSVQAGNMDKIDAEAGKARANFADTYNPNSAYALRSWCIHDGELCQCTTPIGSGGEAWNQNHWARRKVTECLASGTMRTVPMTIGTTDWTGSSAPYTATVDSLYITTTSVDLVVWGSNLTNAKAHISSEKKSGAGGMKFTTSVKPTGSVSCTVLVWDNDDGKVGTLLQDTVVTVANGGTGQSTVAGAKQALGVTAVEESVSTLSSQMTSLVTYETQSLYYDVNGISAQITVPTGYVPFLAIPQEGTASGAYLINGSGGAYFCSCIAIANKTRNTRIYFIKV